MPFPILGAIAVGLTAASTAASIAASANQPETPGVSTQAEGVKTAAKTLPEQRRIAALAQQGGTGLRSGFTQMTKAELQQAIAKGNVPDLDAARQQLAAMKDGDTAYMRSHDGQFFPEKWATVDFTGMGEADVQGSLANQYADLMLDLGNKYGEQFVAEAKKQLELSDPEGTAARAKMNQMIQEQIAREPDRPVADLLDQQVSEQLASGRNLDSMSRGVLESAMADAQNARGQSGATVDQFAQPLQTGLEGDARQQAAIQKSLGWLSSGATPEDTAFRREQQNLSNLGAFTQGATPQAQFQNLSGAQQGATPFTTGGAQLPRMDQNAGATSQQFALNNWNTASNYAATQANPWMAGLSTLISGASAAGTAGWKPLGT